MTTRQKKSKRNLMSKYTPDYYQQFIHLSRYARWDYEKKRRETWEETVDRYMKFFKKTLKENNNYEIPKKDYDDVRQAILNHEVMPSMRALMTAGDALEHENIAGYNCAYTHVNHVHAFDEVLYILMNGTGVGFSVENQHVSKLPDVPNILYDTATAIVVEDSKLGWAKAFREIVTLLYTGHIPQWDLSRVRPAGSVLKRFGGRASGPEPLDSLFKFTIKTFKNAQGRKLTPIECHDILCKVGEVVVVGGVRRSALISLSDLSDQDMSHAKSGQWYLQNVQRALANNSANYHEKPSVSTFLREWTALYDSKSGERGLFSSKAAKAQVPKRREKMDDFGCNPCSEIILRGRTPEGGPGGQFCNLTEVVVREKDNQEDLIRKVGLATIIGTWQATLTDFQYINPGWKQNCDDERLLGVSLTGICDNELMTQMTEEHQFMLEQMRFHAQSVNTEMARELGINPSAAITCIKPSGTVSQMVNSASGIHPRWSDHYIRTVRMDNKDPLKEFMVDQGFQSEPDITKPDHTTVFSFPQRAPRGSLKRSDISAIKHLELWLFYQRHFCEHKPSVTINVKEEEWLEVGAWVYKHFDEMCGVSFLPYADHSYKQAPYQECSEEEYEKILSLLPKDLTWNDLSNYEQEDYTVASQELACVGGSCEI